MLTCSDKTQWLKHTCSIIVSYYVLKVQHKDFIIQPTVTFFSLPVSLTTTRAVASYVITSSVISTVPTWYVAVVSVKVVVANWKFNVVDRHTFLNIFKSLCDHTVNENCNELMVRKRVPWYKLYWYCSSDTTRFVYLYEIKQVKNTQKSVIQLIFNRIIA